MKMRFVLVMTLLALSGCKGDMGPVGPQGEQGVQGPQGVQGATGPAGESFQYFIGYDAISLSGRGEIDLPIGAGTSIKQPLVTCYTGDTSGAWLVAGTDLSVGGLVCGLVWRGNHWQAVLMGSLPGWTFRVVAVW